MSTLEMRQRHAARADVPAQSRMGLIERFVRAREAQARRRIQTYLSGLDDDRLRHFGYSEEEIDSIRAGGFVGAPGERRHAFTL